MLFAYVVVVIVVHAFSSLPPILSPSTLDHQWQLLNILFLFPLLGPHPHPPPPEYTRRPHDVRAACPHGPWSEKPGRPARSPQARVQPRRSWPPLPRPHPRGRGRKVRGRRRDRAGPSQRGWTRGREGGRGGGADVPELLSAFGKARAREVGLAPVEVAHVPEGEARAVRRTHAVSDGTEAGSVSGKAKALQKTREDGAQAARQRRGRAAAGAAYPSPTPPPLRRKHAGGSSQHSNSEK